MFLDSSASTAFPKLVNRRQERARTNSRKYYSRSPFWSPLFRVLATFANAAKLKKPRQKENTRQANTRNDNGTCCSCRRRHGGDVCAAWHASQMDGQTDLIYYIMREERRVLHLTRYTCSKEARPSSIIVGRAFGDDEAGLKRDYWRETWSHYAERGEKSRKKG